jgi:hypothetical protein
LCAPHSSVADAVAHARVREGDYVRVHVWPARFPPAVHRPTASLGAHAVAGSEADAGGVDWRSRVVFADARELFLVVDKPRGAPIHATQDNARENALTQVCDAG